MIYKGTYGFKVRSLEFLGIKNVSSAKKTITYAIFNHYRRFDWDINYDTLNKVLWSITFDPKDPDNGWGYGNYKTVYPLTGKNVEIVPAGSIGYLLDSMCTYGHSDHHIYNNAVIGNSQVREKDSLQASVYCYVSEDFNGDIVCIRADGNTYGDRVGEYNYEMKGVWQKLIISPDCENGSAPVSLYFNKQGDTTISNLKGFIIFAFPQYLLNQNETPPADLNSQRQKEYGFGYKSLFFNPVIFLRIFNQPFDNDIIRNWAKRIVKEDTTDIKFDTSYVIDSTLYFLNDDRLMHWKFALHIFSKEYNWTKKIIGGGFDHLSWFGYYFLNDKTKSDWPHNPFLSVLLYSGIIGLLIYIFFLYKVFYYYIKYIKEYPLLFIFFLITFFFSFFSGGSPFDPPIMGFFVMLPFFIHYIHNKEASSSSQPGQKK